MKDGPIKGIIKRVTSACYAVDVRLNRWLLGWRDGQAPFELRGACRDCGKCCETPCIMVPPLVFHVRLFRRIFLWWQHHVNGFVKIGEDREGHIFIFKCTHWLPDSRRCDSYSTRPGMCRDYPRALLQGSKPDFFAECGYYPVYRNSEAMREALKALNLPPEKLQELEEKLHLER